MLRAAAEKMSETALPPAELGPTWDLSSLYLGTDDPALEADLVAAEAEAAAIETAYKGRLPELDGDQLAAMLVRYEALTDRIGRASSYAQLRYAADRDDPEVGRFFQAMQERTNAIWTKLLFVGLEVNKLEEEALSAKVEASEALQRFNPWLRDTRAYRPHQLGDDVEKALHEKYVVGRAAWNRLFDETLAALRFPLDGRDLTSAEIFDALQSKDRDRRRAAAGSISQTLNQNLRLFSRITNTLAKDKQIEDGWRKFERPISSRNLANQVEDEVVDALIQAVQAAYPRTSHRYYALKARWMGLDRLEYWDRNAPLPEDSDVRRPWAEAKVVVLNAYRTFSPTLAGIVDQFFTKSWIDAEVRPGKDSGAFCHSTVPSAHPFVLMNYQGRTRDVMTLAHELGHGVHQVLAARQGPLMSGTPLTLAETASVFGEQLTFRALLDNETDPVRRRVLLAAKIEDMINTVVRQIAFAEFERRVHDARAKAELTPDELGAIWMGVQTESLGPAFDLPDEYRSYWSYIPHFIHVPFYVYAYAFGDCLVNSLYAVYRQQPDGFEPKYLEMLAAGGTLRHKELLAPFGLDATDPDFWSRGLGVLEGFIDELEASLGDRV
ncbi:MAG TPA: M3 family oligoendopeptidase [Geminicoccaceae bacterium]|nr:M3 family oligoendopeptidase [Geminicoccus sp.]HMU53267.1 M3 family oligoendopeptidase [Geminicoccaceae bacterium]